MSADPWEFAIDVGGTFTDCLARSPNGATLQHKVLSSGVVKGVIAHGSTLESIVDPLRARDPSGFWNGARLVLFDAAGRSIASGRIAEFDIASATMRLEQRLPGAAPGMAYELNAGFEAPVLAIRYLLALPPGKPTPPVRLRLGTTRGTNALLTRTGARTALAVTRGFGDLLEIGYQDRPRLFDLAIKKPSPLAECTIEIAERVAADGQVLTEPDADVIRGQLQGLVDDGIQSLAICLLHADLYPAHEVLVEDLAREVGITEISCSSAVAPLVKIVARGETTVVDAYLNPVLRDYVARLEQSLPGSQIRIMTSAGGLKRADAFRGFESVLSGPAGGVVGYARAAQGIGRTRAIGFDMGGTSTDVSRFDGQFDYEYETQKAGVRLVAPTLAIETVAAGGGSICAFDGVKLTVGPASAGAEPGPACYGRGGPLCVTDLNMYLGRIAADRFPFPPDRPAVNRRLESLSGEVASATGERVTPIQLAEGLLDIANANMARAIHNVTIARGYDPADYLMVAFGGAAAQHACAVARELGIREILHDPEASLLSAQGIGVADITRHAAAGVYRSAATLSEVELADAFERVTARLVEEIVAESVNPRQIDVRRSLDVRYRGVDATINVPIESGRPWIAEFERAHRRQFGYIRPGHGVEVAAVRVEAIGRAGRSAPETRRAPPCAAAAPAMSKAVFVGQTLDVAVFDREWLCPGARIDGPAIVAEQYTSVVVEPGWSAEMLTGGQLLLTDSTGPEAMMQAMDAPEAVLLEVFNNLLAGAAERMGHVLRRTAMSVNVKERLDYSCAVFTAAGELVASAAHIPVHLGAMGATVRALLAENPDLRPGDVFVTNDPYRGGSHLPDVTLALPVHDDSSGRLMFWVACRAHHAEIGGIRPGSMPPRATRLGEEGVIVSNFLLVRDGRSRNSELRELLTAGPYPSRAVEENLADIRAQLAALHQGAADLWQLVERHTWPVVERQMYAVQAAAETKVRQALSRLPAAERRFVDYMETPDGSSTPIAVSVSLNRDPTAPAATFDFTGTGPVVRGNLNANPAIVGAAVLYVLRLLVNEHIPFNEGALRAVEILLPECLLNPPAATPLANSPAVAAGNVETSQRIVDVVLGALGLAAASQGTMNNVLFGAESFGFYETVCGGSGATPEADGASAVQVHMTNTRSTDPEVLERRWPVRLWKFGVRRGSGGPGRHRGGDGAVRRIEFLAPLDLSLITQRRGPHPPFGLAGGDGGALGENVLYRADGSVERLAGLAERAVAPGDVLEVRTPGGGGYGAAD
jgi:5-oxoprolinase (ATP-hydrolysing)